MIQTFYFFPQCIQGSWFHDKYLRLPSGAGHVAPLHGEEEPFLHNGEDAHLLVRGQVGGGGLVISLGQMLQP